MISHNSILTISIGSISSQIHSIISNHDKSTSNIPVKVDTQKFIRSHGSSYHCSRGSLIKDEVYNIMEDIRKAIECVDRPILSMLVLVDAQDATCSSILSAFLPEFKHSSPHIIITVVNLTFGHVYGLYTMNIMVGAYHALEYADNMMIRDINSSSQLISSRTIISDPDTTSSAAMDDFKGSKGVSLDDMYRVTTYDMMVLQSTMIIADDIIQSHIITPGKIFDIRSSYWKYVAKSRAKRVSSTGSHDSISDYHAFRSLANHIRSAHHQLPSSSLSLSSSSQHHMYTDIDNALFYSLDVKEVGLGSLMKSSYTDTEVKVALDWASPSYHWLDPHIHAHTVDHHHNISKKHEVAVCLYDDACTKNMLHGYANASLQLLRMKAYQQHRGGHRLSHHDHHIDEIEMEDICNHVLQHLETSQYS